VHKIWNFGFVTANCGIKFTSDRSDTEATHAVSVDSDDTVPRIKCGTPENVKKKKKNAMVHQFTASNCVFIHTTAHHMNSDDNISLCWLTFAYNYTTVF
jgi:hypothetical protein